MDEGPGKPEAERDNEVWQSFRLEMKRALVKVAITMNVRDVEEARTSLLLHMPFGD